MCGIAGAVSLDSRSLGAAVGRMMRAMVHRGPDDEGYEQFPFGGAAQEPACGFGFRRLAIMDLSALGHQPMINHETGDAIIFNGEIYNFHALRQRLEDLGHRFRSTGDTEVLLRALSEWGERALEELDGMFGIAFYHAATQRVLLARDPLGIKPLYVARVKDAIVFASEVRAVLASGLVPDDLDPAGVASFLAYGSPQDPLTVHRFVRSMPAGCSSWLDAASLAGSPVAQRRYWRLPPLQSWCPDDVAVARVKDELAGSVRRQCAADVPLGVFLSGGIDSATMAALAVTTHGPPQTFAVGFEVTGVVDETTAAADTAQALGTRHYQTIVDDDWVLLQWTSWLMSADRPSIDGLNTYIVSGAVKDRNITVALSGLGADELFGGYPSFHRVPMARRMLAAIAWLPADLRRSLATTLLSPLPAQKRAKVIDFVSSGTSPVDLAMLSRRVFSDGLMRHLGFQAKALGLSPLYLSNEAYEVFEPPARDSFQAVSQAELFLYMNNTLLRDSDTNSMAHSLEIRVPFLGQRLVDYVASLPGSVRSPKGTKPKHLLREAMADRLPASVFNRPKAGFSLPFGDWLFGPLKPQCDAAIETLASSSIVDGAVLRRFWDDCHRRRREIHWSKPLALVVLGNYLAEMAGRRQANRL
jgi:asparagine synthase (glutamine-hydrolysing)